MSPDTLEAVKELRDTFRLSWKEIEAKIGYSESWCRAVYSGRVPVGKKKAKRIKQRKQDWYAMAAEIVMATAESIDSVCRRLELDPQKLVDRMYG